MCICLCICVVFVMHYDHLSLDTADTVTPSDMLTVVEFSNCCVATVISMKHFILTVAI